MVHCVGRAAELGERAGGPCRGTRHLGVELLGGDPAAARALEEEAAGADHPHGQLRQPAVGGESPGDVLLALGERRRVHHHEVEPPAVAAQAFQLLERIRHDRREAAGRDLRPRRVVGQVAAGDRERRLAEVDRDHLRRSAGGGVHREPAGAGEDVQHPGTGRHAPGQDPVVALVEEVAGLLPVHHICLEPQAALLEQHRPVRWRADQRIAFLQPVQCRGVQLAGQAQDHGGRVERRLHRRQQVRQVGNPRGRVQLHHQGAVVGIQHQAGEAVVLPVEHPVSRGVAGGEQRPAHGTGRGDPGRPEGGVHRDRLAVVQHLEADRAGRVPQPDGREGPVRPEDDGQVAGGAVSRHGGDGLGEDPRVAATDPAECIRRQAHGQPGRRRAGEWGERGHPGRVRHWG